jgi:hypothetical protein
VRLGESLDDAERERSFSKQIMATSVNKGEIRNLDRKSPELGSLSQKITSRKAHPRI